jgi:hypothetical protein
VKPFLTSLLLLGGLIFQSAFSTSLHAADHEVGAELVVPPAETYVIGDRIPLYWRFTNRSTDALGFMWEGCCRVNGRLTISKDGNVVAPIPPGQALAHMFAKAEVLAPGKSRDFDSFLSDWVVLPETGTYELHGRYTGVLDFQKPQVPRGVDLWRAAAETATNRLSVVSVTDYLKEREERIRKRGLTLALSGPLKFPLLGTADWSLNIINSGTAPRTFRWPDDFSVWVVNAQGFRETAVPSDLDGEYAEVTLQPGQHLNKHLKLDYGRMEGEPLGRYQFFIDLKTAADGTPRVPSNPLPLFWEFTAPDVAQLVTKAASGSKAGFRNPALKFLRVYLAELEPLLKTAQLPATETKALELLNELQLAAALKASAPQPGRKDWALQIAPSGVWQLADASARTAFPPGTAPLEQARQLLDVRRHLGLEMSFTFQPEAKATAATWFTTAQALASLQSELTAPVHLRALPQSTNYTGIVNVRLEATPANVVILLRRSPEGLQKRVAVKLPTPQPTATTTLFAAGDLKSMVTVTSGEQLLELISNPALRAPQIQVFCPVDTTLAELQQALAPIWAKVNQVDLALTQ